jgi:hypothetical protein
MAQEDHAPSADESARRTRKSGYQSFSLDDLMLVGIRIGLDLTGTFERVAIHPGDELGLHKVPQVGGREP